MSSWRMQDSLVNTTEPSERSVPKTCVARDKVATQHLRSDTGCVQGVTAVSAQVHIYPSSSKACTCVALLMTMNLEKGMSVNRARFRIRQGPRGSSLLQRTVLRSHQDLPVEPARDIGGLTLDRAIPK